MKYILIFLSIVTVSSCVYDSLEAPVECDLEGPTLILIESQDSNCGQSDGFVSLSAVGGNGGYTFRELNIPRQEQGSFNNLSAGIYQFEVIDENECNDILSVNVNNIGGVIITDLDVQNTGCEANNGIINITAADGTPPYQYQLGGGGFQSDNIFLNLSAGNHVILVKDSNDCDFTQEINISSDISFINDIKPIIENNCAVTGCHNGSQFPNLTSYSGIMNSANEIKNRTGSKSMPLGGSISQSEINAIKCWVEDGALEN